MLNNIKAVAIAIVISLGVAQAASAKEESTLRIGVNATDIRAIDPHTAPYIVDMTVMPWIYGALVRFSPGTINPETMEPDLAESWESSEDGLTWTFKLRKGVQFHHGFGEVTAEDVVTSLTRAADPTRSAYAINYVSFDRVEAVDPYTVRITLNSVVPNLLGLVSNYRGGFIISKKALEQNGDAGYKTLPVGFGPFEFVEHRTQTVLVVRANDNYFRGRPEIDRIEYRFIPSDANRELAFRSGELDLIAGARNQRWVDRIKKLPNVSVDIFGPGELRVLHLNRNVEPMDDIRIREAIVRAVNVDDLVMFAGEDVATARRSVVPGGYAGAKEFPEYYLYDPERAKSLLAEAGFADGLVLESIVSNHEAQLPVMEIVQDQLKQVGIDLRMNVMDHAAYHAEFRKDISAITFYGAARFPIADSILTEFYHSRGQIGSPTQALNISHCDAADAEIDGARTTMDHVKQNELWAIAQEKIAQQYCSAPLFELNLVWVRTDKLQYGFDLLGDLSLGPTLTEKTTLNR